MRFTMNRQNMAWTIVLGAVFLSTVATRNIEAWQASSQTELKAQSNDAPVIRRILPSGDDQDKKASSTSQRETQQQLPKVRASSFQGVTPGETTTTELIETLGEPQSRQEQAGEEVFTYRVGPFPRVEVMVSEGVISSIIIYLEKLAPPEDVAKELKLDTYEAVLIRSESGTVMGQIYPERGVMFSFDPDAEGRMVGQLVLEQITAEPFLMRVRQDRDHQYKKNLSDLEYAHQYAPNSADIYWVKAQILESIGNYRRALSAVDKAVGLKPQDARLLTTRAKIHFKLDDHEAAIADAKAVIADKVVPPEYQARANCLLADFMANGPDHRYNEALRIHQEALQMAVQLATTDRTEVRRYAKRVLVDAYFGVANDIARGKWQNKQETMLKWLKGASEIAYGMLEYDEGETALRLEIIHRTLRSYAGLKINADAEKAVGQLLNELDQVVRTSPDFSYQNELRWIAIETLYEAIEISRTRGDNKQVIKFAEEAEKLIDQLNRQREPTPHSDHLMGKIYFYAGLAESIGQQNHQKAVQYYEKSLPYFSVDLPARNAPEHGLHGERFVSMGVSYWQTRAQDVAVKLTERGLEIMLAAERVGRLEEAALAVPYGNLATMFEALEDPDRASRYAARAAAIESR
jgi:tetratricopeptide (TPR) repeat protein